MNSHRKILAAVGASAIAVGLSLSTTAVAQAAPQLSVSHAATATVYARFNLLSPNASVSFTVNGVVVGTGVTDDNGDVALDYTPTGLAPGYYRLVATAETGITSFVAFGVR